MENLPQWIGIFIGIITGASGLMLGIMNYLRDNPKISITLGWDLEPFGNLQLEKDQLYGIIRVTNIGRRPVFVSHVSICVPKIKELLITDSINGDKLSEGDAPRVYPIKQEGLEEFRDFWDKMQAVVRDSTGKRYHSKPSVTKPSWAE